MYRNEINYYDNEIHNALANSTPSKPGPANANVQGATMGPLHTPVDVHPDGAADVLPEVKINAQKAAHLPLKSTDHSESSLVRLESVVSG